MKSKWMKKIAMLLAVSTFVTQLSYFPVKAAESTMEPEAATEIMTEAESDTQLESVLEAIIASEAETETVMEIETDSESQTATEAVTIPETETEVLPKTEVGTEVTTETETEDTSETMMETETQTEISAEAETETAEHEADNQGTSLSGISFQFSDIRDSQESASKVLNTDDGKQAVYIFGGLTTCSNTSTAVRALSNCVTYYDKDKINMYVFDIKTNDTQTLVSWLNSNEISEDITVGSIYSSADEKSFYNTCAEKTIGYGSFTMPIIVYKGTDGEIYTYTTGYQTEAKICTNIEAGGLSKIEGTQDGIEKEGLLYIASGVKYNMAYEILDLLNAERQKEGLPALVMDKDLLDAAMQRAVEIEVYYIGDHTRPNGEICFTASEKMNGENIAWGQSGAKDVMNAWMNSPGHRSNILREEFRSVGIGVADAGGRLAFTQCFGVGTAEEVNKPADIAAKTYEVRYITPRVVPSFTQSSVTLAQGDTHEIVVSVLNTPIGDYYNTVLNNSYTWKSSDESVAVVDAAGSVRGVKDGKAVITGTNVLNKAHTLTLEVTVAPDGSGENPGEDIRKTYTVTFDTDGGSHIESLKVYQDETVDEPVPPVKDGYDFAGWQLNGKPYQFNTPVTADITLKAVWTKQENPWGDVLPEDIPSSGSIPKGIWVTGIGDAVYTGKPVTHDIRVYDGNTLLEEKRDYTISYKNNVNAAKKSDPKAPVVIISGKGNYNEKLTVPFQINPKNIGDKDVTADEITLAFTGKAKKVVPVITYKKKLANNKDFVITGPSEYSEAKKYTIAVKGIGNYFGTRNVTLTITEKTLISKASVVKIPDQVYDGKAKTPKITVKLKEELTLNKDYKISYENNVGIGTGAVLIEGMGEYAGIKRVAFKIVSPYKGGKYNIGEDKEKLVKVDMDSTVTFSKGGGVPSVRVSFNGKRLLQGKDYTLSYKDNKAAYGVSRKDATVLITGKGSYCGKITKSFRILEKDIATATLIVNDKVYTGKAKGHVTKITLTDTDGKTMKAGTDYEKEITYTYAAATKLENGETKKAGEAVNNTDIIPAGTTIKVWVKGTGSYQGNITGEYRIIAKENDISKAKITLKTPQYYTGLPIRPDEKQFEVKLGEKVLQPQQYSIVGYTNNVKKGSATVTIRGENGYGGTKTVKFAIGSKPIAASDSNK